MEEYHNIVKEVLTEGQYKENRTGVDTISKFGVSYRIDNSDRYPLLTTKKMNGYRWNSMIHELFWYLSGEEHIKNLREETSIWDAWSNEEGHLDTAYGRFWRRYPIPPYNDQLDGEAWNDMHENQAVPDWMDFNDDSRWTFDQIQYVIDELKENPNSRRLVVNAWHPANAAISTLPPCHYSFVFNVQGNHLNLHLTQRSGDVALGVPFNIACYTLLQRMIAQEVGLAPGHFHHTIVDAHVYCGEGERGEWYERNMSLMEKIHWGDANTEMLIKKDIGKNAPEDPDNLDHVPGLLKQIQRDPFELPEIEIADKPFDELNHEDIVLKDYKCYDGIEFGVAE